MPKKVRNKIINEYENKGYSYKDSKRIAYATMVKKGIWKRK